MSGGAAGDEAALAQTRMEVGLDVPRAIFSVLQRSCSVGEKCMLYLKIAFRKCAVSCHQRRMRIVLFWLYVCKYENEAIAALAVFRRVVSRSLNQARVRKREEMNELSERCSFQVPDISAPRVCSSCQRAAADFSVWRFFLSRLLSLCGPPYASPFCLAVLYLALEMVETRKSS